MVNLQDTVTQVEIGAAVCAGGLVFAVLAAVMACRHRRRIAKCRNMIIDYSQSSDDDYANNLISLRCQTSQSRTSGFTRQTSHARWSNFSDTRLQASTSFNSASSNSSYTDLFDAEQPAVNDALGVFPDYSMEDLTVDPDYSVDDALGVFPDYSTEDLAIDPDYSVDDNHSVDTNLTRDYSEDNVSDRPDYSTDEELDTQLEPLASPGSQQPRPFSYIGQRNEIERQDSREQKF